MAKLYSYLFFIFVFYPALLNAQNVGVGTSNPREKLEVAGAILIGTTTDSNTGTIRYNSTTNKFEGRDNLSWKEFGGSGGGESLWVPDGVNIYPDTQYTGNVGIGTFVPLTKLHVKGNGIIALRAETASGTLPAVDVINTTGTGLKVTTNGTTAPGAIFHSDQTTALHAETDADSYSAIYALNKDSAGYALKVVSWAALDTISGNIVGAEGGNAAHVVGDLNIWGALRNTDSTLYGGSVAVNDGMTVGEIAGASCTPETDTTGTFTVNFGTNFEAIFNGGIGQNGNETYNNIITFNVHECRAVTKFYFEPYVGDDQVFPLDFEMWVRGQYIASVYEPSANLDQNPPRPDLYPAGPLQYFGYNSSLCGCYTSKWGFDSNVFNGEDPADVINNDWFVQFAAHTIDGEYLFGYMGRVSYKYGDTIDAPAYAAYGDIRASGSIYANSDDLLGDVAEYFKVAAGRQPEVGDIVSISRKDPQTFELSSKAFDPLVVGVVSENPSVHLNDPKSGYPIGLTGRVKVKVNLMGGKIAIGDPITTSSAEGVGMKANGAGTIVGYALEAFDGSRTDEGNIIILLARGHVEKISPTVKVEEIENPTYGGMVVKGSVKVVKDEATVFVPWDAKLSGRMPADVEFEDLFVELTPFGGDAKMIVKDVNAEGITVEIITRSEGFKGFYYTTDIVTGDADFFNEAEKTTAAMPGNYEERVTRATQLYKDWNDVYEKLQSRGGMSLSAISKMNSGKEISLYKKEVVKSWQRNSPDLFAQWQNLGRELSQTINHDQSIIRKMKDIN